MELNSDKQNNKMTSDGGNVAFYIYLKDKEGKFSTYSISSYLTTSLGNRYLIESSNSGILEIANGYLCPKAIGEVVLTVSSPYVSASQKIYVKVVSFINNISIYLDREKTSEIENQSEVNFDAQISKILYLSLLDKYNLKGFEIPTDIKFLIKIERCSELYERYISGYNGTGVNVSYDDCNPFGMIAGDFGEITSLSKHTSQSASESTIVAFNSLSELFATFMGNFEIPTNGTEYIPTVSGNALNSYTQFYNKAIELYNNSLVSFTKNVSNDLTRSAVIGVNHPYTMAFGGDISPELIDFQTVIANLFGFSSKTEFMDYAQALANTYAQHRTNITNSLPTNEALENGCFYTSNGSFVFPIAVKNRLASTVLAYVILDTSGLVSVWVNDITAALWATNFNSSYHTDSMINNELYCKNILFVTGPIEIKGNKYILNYKLTTPSTSLDLSEVNVVEPYGVVISGESNNIFSKDDLLNKNIKLKDFYGKEVDFQKGYIGDINQVSLSAGQTIYVTGGWLL